MIISRLNARDIGLTAPCTSPSRHPRTSNLLKDKDHYTSDYSIDMPPAYVADEIEMSLLYRPAAKDEERDDAVELDVSCYNPEILYCFLC